MPAVALSRVVESGPAARIWPPEPRRRLEALLTRAPPRRRIYPLACLVAIAICAYTAAGNDRFTAAGQRIRRASQADLARLRAPRRRKCGSPSRHCASRLYIPMITKTFIQKNGAKPFMIMGNACTPRRVSVLAGGRVLRREYASRGSVFAVRRGSRR